MAVLLLVGPGTLAGPRARPPASPPPGSLQFLPACGGAAWPSFEADLVVYASALALQCLGELSIVPSIFAYQSPRFKTPVVSILFVSGAAAGLCHLTYVTKYGITPTRVYCCNGLTHFT